MFLFLGITEAVSKLRYGSTGPYEELLRIRGHVEPRPHRTRLRTWRTNAFEPAQIGHQI